MSLYKGPLLSYGRGVMSLHKGPLFAVALGHSRDPPIRCDRRLSCCFNEDFDTNP